MRITEAKYSESPVHISNHFHDCHQILYIASGEIHAIVEGEEKAVPEGSFLILNRFEEHSIKASGEICTRYTLRISDEGGEGAYGELISLAEVLINRAKSYGHILDAKSISKKVIPILSEMASESREGKPLKDYALKLLFERLLLLIYRERPELSSFGEGTSYELIRRIKKKLEMDFGERITLASLSEELHVSPSYLSHIFKRETGYAPIDYLTASRISAAKRLLSSTDKPVKEIVYLCGFGDESNFSRMFKKRTALSPSEFRRKYGAK